MVENDSIVCLGSMEECYELFRLLYCQAKGSKCNLLLKARQASTLNSSTISPQIQHNFWDTNDASACCDIQMRWILTNTIP